MQLQRCEYGHYYDPDKYRYCPHCEVADEQEDVGYTVAKASVDNYADDAFDERGGPSDGQGAPLSPDDQPTMAKGRRQGGTDVVTGWLVCVVGTARGTDYQIRAERNTLGRSDKMDISIKGDLGISRENHAVLSYNPRERRFTLIPGEGKSIIYLNGQELLAPAKLSAYDRIEISETTLAFMPLCSEYFSWDDESNR